MENNLAMNTPLRISIISDSRKQRNMFKRLLQGSAAEVVQDKGFLDYQLDTAKNHCDALIIDLENVEDESFDKLDALSEQEEIPVLFHEGGNIPMQKGSLRQAWIDNFVNKLYTTAHHKPTQGKQAEQGRQQSTQTQATPPKSPVDSAVSVGAFAVNTTFGRTNDSPNNSNNHTIDAIAIPVKRVNSTRVAIISTSRTRRRTLSLLLDKLGLNNITEHNFSITGNLRELFLTTDVLLIDRHNVGPGEAAAFFSLAQQKEVPYIVYNSSNIPHESNTRHVWGNKLLANMLSKTQRQTLKRLEPKIETPKIDMPKINTMAPIAPIDTIPTLQDGIQITPQGPVRARDRKSVDSRLDKVLTTVRKSLQSIEDSQTNNTGKHTGAPGQAQRELANRLQTDTSPTIVPLHPPKRQGQPPRQLPDTDPNTYTTTAAQQMPIATPTRPPAYKQPVTGTYRNAPGKPSNNVSRTDKQLPNYSQDVLDQIDFNDDPLRTGQDSSVLENVLRNSDVAFNEVWDFLVDGKDEITQTHNSVEQSAFLQELQSLKNDLESFNQNDGRPQTIEKKPRIGRAELMNHRASNRE